METWRDCCLVSIFVCDVSQGFGSELPHTCALVQVGLKKITTGRTKSFLEGYT